MTGWIKVNRSLLDHWLWNDKPYSKGQAWMDLLLMANYEDHQEVFRGQIQNYHRGEVNRSYENLASRWGWDRRKVSRFLMALELEGMVSLKVTKRSTTVTLVNYDKYQGDGTSGGTSGGTSDGTSDGTHTRIIKNEKKEKNIKVLTDLTSHGAWDTRDCIELWNDLKTFGIPEIKDIKPGTERCKIFMARSRQYTMDDYRTAIDNIRHSDFLQGYGDRGFMITFDWFIRPNNFIKVLEGNYISKPAAPRRETPEEEQARRIQAFLDRHKEDP